MKKTSSILLITIILLQSFAYCSDKKSEPEKKPKARSLVIYESDKYKFKMDLPKSWTVQKDVEGIVFLGFSKDQKQRCSMMTQYIVPDITLEQYMTQIKKDFPASLKNFKLIEEGSYKHNKRECIYLTYTYKDNDKTHKNIAFFSKRGKASYLITFMSDEKTFDTNKDFYIFLSKTFEYR